MKADCYELLGIARGADAETLKKAYRALAMKYHPDRNPGDKAAEQKFKEATEAYEILRDPEKRAAYDRFGHAAFQNGGGRGGAGGQGGGPFDFGFGGSFADIFDEVFSDIMGGGRGGKGQGRGADVRADLEVTLEEAFTGIEKNIRLATTQTCEACKGNGAKPGTEPVNCQGCRGLGRVRVTQGFFTIERACPTCGGAGRVIKDPCAPCAGAGRVRKEKTLAVAVPAGIEDGTRLRITAEGEAGMRGAPPGDLYVFLSIAPHPFFKREGGNLYCRVPIPMPIAALGGDIEIPTIDGRLMPHSVPAGTQTGQQFRIKGQGMHPLNSRSRGDLYLQAFVETPTQLNKRQKELLREFEKAGSDDTCPESTGFLTRIREFLGSQKQKAS